MGKPIPPIEFGPGLRSFESLVMLLADQEKFTKLMDSMKAQVAALNERIEVVGKVNEIQQIKQETIKDRARAVRDLEAAKTESKKIRTKAAEGQVVIEADLNAREEAVTAREKEANQRIVANERAMTTREKAVEKFNEELAGREKKAEALEKASREMMEKAITNAERLDAAIRDLKQ